MEYIKIGLVIIGVLAAFIYSIKILINDLKG